MADLVIRLYSLRKPMSPLCVLEISGLRPGVCVCSVLRTFFSSFSPVIDSSVLYVTLKNKFVYVPMLYVITY